MTLRSQMFALTSIALGLSLSACRSCTEQHNPRPLQEKIAKESATANAPVEKLNPDGTIPVKAAAPSAAGGAAKNAGTQKYEQFCAACHGVDGLANGPGALAMNPKPRNLTDAKWQASVDDAHIAKVIKEGGAAVGLSSTMAAWGAVVNDQEITEMVAHIRSLKK